MSTTASQESPLSSRPADVAPVEIYMDNAATSFPKPPAVEAALVDYARHVGGSAGRGAYPRAARSAEILLETRKALAALFHVADPLRFVFTLNCTDALNLAIKGLDWKAGDEALVSAIEHNSVVRPLRALSDEKGIRIVRVPASPQGLVDPADYERLLSSRTRLVALVHASNVCGTLQPIEAVGRLARARGIPFLVDAAQSAGAVPIDLSALPIDLLAFPGHKALLGPLGTGGLYIRAGMDLKPLREGGTGSLSEQDRQPDFLPDKYEPGSHNAIGIAGWKAGLDFLIKEGVASVRAHERRLTDLFLKGLSDVPGLRVFGPQRAEDRVAVIPVRKDGWEPQRLSAELYRLGRIMTRSGLHCAPGAHQAIGTYPEGATRFSLGYSSTEDEVREAIRRLGEFAANFC